MNSNKFFKKLRYRPYGFTLVEIMVATLILSVMTYALYTLFSQSVKNVDIGEWKAKTQIKLRAAAKQLHKDISSATYPSMIKLNDTTVEKDVKWNLKVKEGNTVIKGASDTLLEFYICSPGRDVPDDKVDQKIIKCTLKAENTPEHTRVNYLKTLEKGTAAPGDDIKGTTLLEDIVYFDAKLLKFEDPNAFDVANKVKYVLRIEMQCAHPKYPKTIVTEAIEVPLLVKTNNKDPNSKD